MEKKLKSLGLSRLEIKTYLYLLRRGKVTAKELAKETGVRLEAIYRPLRSLISKGLVISFGKHPARLQALPIEVGMSKLLENYQNVAQGIINKVRINAIIGPFKIIPNREAYHRLGERYFKKIKKEVLVIASGTGELNQEFIRTKAEAVRKGIEYKILALSLGDFNREKLEAWQKTGFKVRHRKGKEFNLVNYDREIIQIGFTAC